MEEARHPHDASAIDDVPGIGPGAARTGAGGADAVAAEADDAPHPLDPRWVRYQRQLGVVNSLLLGGVLLGAAVGGAAIADVAAAPLIVAAAAAAVVIAALHYWWPAVAYRYASYRLGTRALEIRRGVLWRSVIDVPRSRIQHSDVSQGPLERRHGLGTLSIYTAGTQHALVRLNGLAHEQALAIREHLMQTNEDDVV